MFFPFSCHKENPDLFEGQLDDNYAGDMRIDHIGSAHPNLLIRKIIKSNARNLDDAKKANLIGKVIECFLGNQQEYLKYENHLGIPAYDSLVTLITEKANY